MGYIVFIVCVVLAISLAVRSANKEEERRKIDRRAYAAYEREKKKQEEVEAEERRLALNKELKISSDTLEELKVSNSFAVKSIDYEVSGIYYRTDAAKDAAFLLMPNDTVNLRPDPNNRYDPFAVKVFADRKHIGFVPSRISTDVTLLMHQYKHKTYVCNAYRVYNEKHYDYSVVVELVTFFFENKK